MRGTVLTQEGGSDLAVRELGPEDVAGLDQLAEGYDPTPQTNEWLTRDASHAANLAFVEAALQRSIERRGFWAGLHVDARLVGVIGLELRDREASIAGLDYLLGPRDRGRGLVTRAGRFVVARAFEEHGFERLEILVDAANQPSCRVAERLGFVREGVLRARLAYPGFRGDQVVYGQLRSEWRALAPRAEATATAARPRYASPSSSR